MRSNLTLRSLLGTTLLGRERPFIFDEAVDRIFELRQGQGSETRVPLGEQNLTREQSENAVRKAAESNQISRELVDAYLQATEMQKLLNEGKTKAVFLGVNTAGDTKKDVVAYLNQFKTKISFPYLIDPTQLVNKFYIQRLMPTVIIIDENGIIRYRGSTNPKDVLLSEIKKITGQ